MEIQRYIPTLHYFSCFVQPILFLFTILNNVHSIQPLCGYAGAGVKLSMDGKQSTSHCNHPLQTLCAAKPTLQTWERLSQLVEHKKYQVEQWVQKHADAMDPLQARLSYVQQNLNSKLSNQLRKNKLAANPHLYPLSVIANLKRKSPTPADPKQRQLLEIKNVTLVTNQLMKMGVDCILVNTDSMGWGAHPDDLKLVIEAAHAIKTEKRPAIIAQDLIIHPLQIAQAVEARADAVYLNSLILGSELESLLDVCMVVGTEAIVEVHTLAEAKYACSLGCNILMINQWDRIEGVVRSNQALRIKELLMSDVITIACGGINTVEEITELGNAGFDAICLGRKLIDMHEAQDLIQKVKKKQFTRHIGPHLYSQNMTNINCSEKLQKILSSVEKSDNLIPSPSSQYNQLSTISDPIANTSISNYNISQPQISNQSDVTTLTDEEIDEMLETFRFTKNNIGRSEDSVYNLTNNVDNNLT